MGLGANQSYLRFNVEFQAKDDRFRVAFTELYYYLHDIRYETSNLQQGPSNQAEVETLDRDCLQPLDASLTAAVVGRPAAAAF
jgi:hypothetical protein